MSCQDLPFVMNPGAADSTGTRLCFAPSRCCWEPGCYPRCFLPQVPRFNSVTVFVFVLPLPLQGLHEDVRLFLSQRSPSGVVPAGMRGTERAVGCLSLWVSSA